MTGAWESIKLLGAVSDTGESFFLPCEENFNSDTTIRLLDALQTEFGKKLCVVLDNASYFTANAVQDNAEFLTELGLECVRQPDRRIAVEILLARQKERLATVADRPQQLDRLPRARHRQ